MMPLAVSHSSLPVLSVLPVLPVQWALQALPTHSNARFGLPAGRTRSTAAFTLIEVLAAVLLTSIVMTVAVTIFIDISDATEAATERMRDTRHAVAILDRIAHDLESSFLLVKAPETDPLDHPWMFLGESEHSDASDRLKFVVQSPKRRSSEDHSSDIAVISYALVEDEFGSFDLLRSATPNLPEDWNSEIAIDEEEGAMLLAEGVDFFSVSFMNEAGEWTEEWDSSQLVESGSLPLAAEIEIAFADPDDPGSDFDYESSEDGEEFDPRRYSRLVTIPMRPLPLRQMIDEYIEEVRTGRKASEDDTRGEDKKPSEKFKNDECEQTFYECSIQNRATLIEQVGAQKYGECMNNLPQRCVEDWPGRKICGVRIWCNP